MSSNRFLLSALAILFIGNCAEALDMESAKEQPCFNITRTVPLDLNWVGTIKTLYYPLMSRLDLYRSSANMLNKSPNDINEATVYYDSCFRWNLYTNGSITGRGFNGLSREYKTKLVVPTMEKFEFSPVEGKNYGYSGLKYTTMTDNKTFLFTPFCTDDGEMTWGLGTISPTISQDLIKAAHEHAESLGFKREYFTEIRYDRCNFESVDYTSDNQDNEIDGTTTVTSA
ncbi:hypothetical protein Ocin01_10906 [Orchesella cincta]|uniref:Uncharacterized protein n=1 Tax=Orchesella cincta TaxID=48709 RepID=A0A1D2MST8_ORCCI|nr:hypothetical protein Ocin01_10906 [Orchesella cincta]